MSSISWLPIFGLTKHCNYRFDCRARVSFKSLERGNSLCEPERALVTKPLERENRLFTVVRIAPIANMTLQQFRNFNVCQRLVGKFLEYRVQLLPSEEMYRSSFLATCCESTIDSRLHLHLDLALKDGSCTRSHPAMGPQQVFLHHRRAYSD